MEEVELTFLKDIQSKGRRKSYKIQYMVNDRYESGRKHDYSIYKDLHRLRIISIWDTKESRMTFLMRLSFEEGMAIYFRNSCFRYRTSIGL